jgi:hypothetical protein
MRPAFLPASLNRSLTNVPVSKQYVLFGVPFDPSNASAAAVLEDELGAPNKNNWRFGRFNPATGGYDEHPSPSLNLNGGQGFWLIMKDAVAVGTAGTSRNPVGGFRVTLSPGANMIAHPFLFPVTLADVDFSAAPSVETRLVSFLPGSGYVDSNQLAPWRGYWMFNNGGSAETIVIPGVRSAGARVSPPTVEPDGWWIAATARQGSSVDASNVAGMTRTSALPAATEPPGLPGYVRAYYEDGASGGRRALTRDIRENDRRGASWNLVVDGPTDEPIHLSFDGLSSVPSDFEAILIPERTFASIDLRAQDALVLVGGEHRFELVVGTSEYVQAVRAGQERTPAQFALGLGYPNPLHGSTSVGFALPTDAFVDMNVYDVQGRLVRMLVSETRSAGRHVAPWNARDDEGRAVAPGVYFVRLRAGTFDASHKLVVVR